MRLQILADYARVDYARVLRVIGQDLKQFFPESLEIVLSGNEFVARGYSRPRSSTPEKNPDKTALQNIWQKVTRQHPQADDTPAEPSGGEFVRTYTPYDIDRLNDTGKARRTRASQSPDLYSLEERLRMIGRIMNEKKAEFISIRLDVNDIIFEYRDQEGETHREGYSQSVFYKLQQRYYSERDVALQDPWQEAGR